MRTNVIPHDSVVSTQLKVMVCALKNLLQKADRVSFSQNTWDQNYFTLKIGGWGYFHILNEISQG